MALGLRGPQLTTMDTTATDVALARELRLRVSVHVHGATGWLVAAARTRRCVTAGCSTTVRPSCNNGISDDQVAMMADAGCSVSISPDVELKMGFGRPETGRMPAAGIRPSLLIDDSPSAGGDMFATMRTAFAVRRGVDGGLTARDVVEFATVDGARGCGLDARAGSITVGKDAELILLDVVAAGHPGRRHRGRRIVGAPDTVSAWRR